jgi:hypothetical protein
MFKLDIVLLDYIFPWSNYALYGFGIYAKFIISLFTFQQLVFLIYKKKGVSKK